MGDHRTDDERRADSMNEALWDIASTVTEMKALLERIAVTLDKQSQGVVLGELSPFLYDAPHYEPARR